MDGEFVVRPGQVWADNDVRCKGRTVRVAEVGPLTAICEILTNSDAHQEYVDGVRSVAGYRPDDMRGMRTEIKLRRFRPTSTGYRLLEDVTDAPVA